MTCTGPDIAFAVGKLSRFTSNPGLQHWLAIRRVLRYLERTINYGITYSDEPPILEGCSDASWITNEEDNSSTSGWVFVYGGGDISWASKKQMIIANSTMSAEFIALARRQMKRSG
ncbi:secreted RxLR effector protein 161-like [Amaranthus tricolor]|uniref:secreted RxLR effector protein 161-like n=1 Tax=Amaranthus tricolor TaxID=29722 RepID=UPI00258F4771|nr:secreted RxLR effector protein 161-like [Amaranthus tricolor]